MPLLFLRPLSAAYADVEVVAGGTEEPSVRTAFALFAALTLLLLLFLAGVALLAWSRSRRRDGASGAKPTDDEEAPADAWSEAGRRARAFPSRPPSD